MKRRKTNCDIEESPPGKTCSRRDRTRKIYGTGSMSNAIRLQPRQRLRGAIAYEFRCCTCTGWSCLDRLNELKAANLVLSWRHVLNRELLEKRRNVKARVRKCETDKTSKLLTACHDLGQPATPKLERRTRMPMIQVLAQRRSGIWSPFRNTIGTVLPASRMACVLCWTRTVQFCILLWNTSLFYSTDRD